MKLSTRTSQRLFRFAVDEFIRLLSEVQNRRVVYRCSDADTDSWQGWVKEFESRNYIIGEDFVKTFVMWGVHTWMNPDSNTNRKYDFSIRLNWIFGKAGIKRWDANSTELNKKFIREGFKQDYKITNPVKTRMGDIVLLIRPIEEAHRQRFYNTKRGMAWCLANTFLYHHRSPLCVGCEFKDECKEALRENYPKIYKARGYDK